MLTIKFHTEVKSLLAFLSALTVWATGSGCSTTSSKPLPARITQVNYHGWSDAIMMRGAQTEVIIVPSIGRIMQFQFAGEPGPFWQNRVLDGHLHPVHPTNWINFGGDKTWPAPESEWPKPYGYWLPPAAFDSMPVTAKVEHDEVVLTSPVDPDYGIRVTRRIHLGPGPTQMTVSTRYDKVSGPAKKVGVWTITQLQNPLLVFSPVPWPSRITNAFHRLSPEPPPDIKVDRDARLQMAWLSLTRDPKAAHKIGLKSGSLLWVGENVMLRIDLPRLSGANYPDGGSSAEVYTNPDPLKYVELEMLGPTDRLNPGDYMEFPSTYTLLRRTNASAEADALKVLKP